MKKFFLKWNCVPILSGLAMTLLLVSCGDGGSGTCSDCSCNPSLCDGSADGDASTTMVTLHIETWTLSPDGTPRDLPGADAEVDGKHCTTPCELELPVGNHNLFLTLAGWVQGPNPLPFKLTIDDSVVVNGIPTSIVEVSGLTIRHRLDKDLSGTRWRCEQGCNYPVEFEVTCAEKSLCLSVGENPT